MKFLFFVILATISGVLGAFDREQCKTDYRGLLAPWAEKCLGDDAFDTYEFPLIPLNTADGLTSGRFVANKILACASCDAKDELTAEEVAGAFNYAFSKNAREKWNENLDDWLKDNKEIVKDMDKKITKTSYLLMSPKKTEDADMSAIENKCEILRMRMSSKDYNPDPTDVSEDDDLLEKFQSKAKKYANCVKGAPKKKNKSNGAPGSKIASGGAPGAPGSVVSAYGGAPGSNIG